MSTHAALLASCLAVGPAIEAETTSATRWRDRQSWPVVASGELSSFGFFPTGRHGGGSLGTELTHVHRTSFRLVQPVSLSYSVQRPVFHGPSLVTALAPRWLTRFGLYAGPTLSAGLAHWFAATRTYSAHSDAFESTRDPGRTHFQAALGLELGWELASTTRVPLRIFFRWEQRALTPFAVANAIPVMAGSAAMFGFAVHAHAERVR